MTELLAEEVALAWRAFRRRRSVVVRPAAPILFFGDLGAYRTSPLRVVTVGLNPSRHEFPADAPFRRFPLLARGIGGETTRYLDAMSAYFRNEPYRGWFNTFEAFLEGLGASYYDGEACRALHTDLCSPRCHGPDLEPPRRGRPRCSRGGGRADLACAHGGATAADGAAVLGEGAPRARPVRAADGLGGHPRFRPVGRGRDPFAALRAPIKVVRNRGRAHAVRLRCGCPEAVRDVGAQPEAGSGGDRGEKASRRGWVTSAAWDSSSTLEHYIYRTKPNDTCLSYW